MLMVVFFGNTSSFYPLFASCQTTLVLYSKNTKSKIDIKIYIKLKKLPKHFPFMPFMVYNNFFPFKKQERDGNC